MAALASFWRWLSAADLAAAHRALWYPDTRRPDLQVAS